MSGLRTGFLKYVAATVLIVSAGIGSAWAEEDVFTLEIDAKGEPIAGDGSGFDGGLWYYYANTNWWNQWFYNGPYNRTGRKVVEVDLTFRVLDPTSAVQSTVEVALNWTTGDWPDDIDNPAPPLPDDIKGLSQEELLIERHVIVPQRTVTQSIFINTSYEIEAFCPAWVSIDVRGKNVSIEGVIRHECVSDEDPTVPVEDRDFGDAPEGALAYPSSGILGQFPTCVGVGPASWIEHDTLSLYFGARADIEANGNGGICPAFNPNLYDQDEGMTDGDAGLLKPRAYTIKGSTGSEEVYPLVYTGLESMGSTCLTAIWGTNIDINVHNRKSDGRGAYVNLLVDWNQDGKWEGTVPCDRADVPEHALVNFPIPDGYEGSLSALAPPSFQLGPFAGYVWTRFSITDQPVPDNWTGDGVFGDGETEDYLLLLRETPAVCNWEEGDLYKMHWAQLPDLWPTGMDVDMYATSLADDFRCAETGPITSIHFWGSFLDDTLPTKGVDSLEFEINIYSNQPADNLISWSRPGQLLWTARIEPYSYDVHQVTNSAANGWFDPASKYYEPDNHKRGYKFSICFDDEDDPFIQKMGTTYWIEIKEVPSDDTSYVFGWKTTQQPLQWADSAVWLHTTLGWLPMAYPDEHDCETRALDLAFVVAGEPPVDMDFGDAPDRPYPTLHLSDGARHTIDEQVYLGRGVDAEADGQPDGTATGDDHDGSNDEDGVVFTSALVIGGKATVKVTASTTGALNAWIDFNSDNDWDDVGEQVFVDQPLSAGVNALSFDVPTDAVPAGTFSRWRFSRTRGLDYTGLAPDGEVEDYMVTIEEAFVSGQPPVERLEWSQPPLEWDPSANVPVYCGWDEPAFTSRPVHYGWSTWKIVADDFRCPGAMPVTSIHWWGSYQNWAGDEPPATTPTSWQIGFWSHLAADGEYAFGRPGQLLWVVTVDPERVTIDRAGADEFPDRPSDTCFQYLLELSKDECFWPAQYLDGKTDQTLWISITAVYVGASEPRYVWGWKTRPEPWGDGAVSFEYRRDGLRAGISTDNAVIEPVADSLVCERQDKYDVAFELDTDPDYVKWEQPFTGLRHWAHYEDEESFATMGSVATSKWAQDVDVTTTGLAVDITEDIPPTWSAQIAGDDFQCTTSGAITGITLWGSWYQDILPSNDVENVTFTLSIRADVPADRSPTGYSMPGTVLWRKVFKRGQFTVRSQQARAQGFYSPGEDIYEQNNHVTVYEYDFDIDAKDAFQQTGTVSAPKVYWLCAQAYVVHSAGSVATRFGWHASSEHWNDDGVWFEIDAPYNGTDWDELHYPKNHASVSRSLDLAFAIQTEEAGSDLTYQRLVADDWQHNGTTPITGLIWWGSYIGYGYQPCACTQMTPTTAPDYFLVSIWTDASDAKTGSTASHYPAEKLWEAQVSDFEEVMVGFDKHPEAGETDVTGFEPVYRYTVALPETDWFCPENDRDIYWLSVAAVYEDADAMIYPWGWTNHPQEAWDLDSLTMLAYWKLDESTGTTAGDSSGNDNDAALLGAAVWRPASGYVAGAIDLDGRRDYLRVDAPAGFDFAGDSFSVSAWVYPREVGGRYQALMEYDRTSSNGNRFGLWIDTEGRFHFRVGTSTSQSVQSLALEQWQHLTAVYNADAGQMNLYVDGVLANAGRAGSGFANPTQAKLTIGVRGDEKDEFFDGLLDEIRVFDLALSDTDVLTLVGAGRNDDAVAGQWTGASWQWTELYDQTGASEDMSFMLLTEPVSCDQGKTDTDDKDDKKETTTTEETKTKS